MLIPLLALLFQPAASTGGGYGAPATGYGGQSEVLDTLLSNMTSYSTRGELWSTLPVIWVPALQQIGGYYGHPTLAKEIEI